MNRFLHTNIRLLTAVAMLTSGLALAKDKKKDPDEIGNRDVGKGVNFYSLEKEIAMGKQFAQEIERQARIVEMKFFAGMTIPEIADNMGLSTATITREWRLAKAWLKRALEGSPPPDVDRNHA